MAKTLFHHEGREAFEGFKITAKKNFTMKSMKGSKRKQNMKNLFTTKGTKNAKMLKQQQKQIFTMKDMKGLKKR